MGKWIVPAYTLHTHGNLTKLSHLTLKIGICLGRLLLTISLGNRASLTSYITECIGNITSRSWWCALCWKPRLLFFGWPGAPQDKKIHSHAYKLTPCVCNDNAYLLHAELLLWMAQNDEPIRKTTLSPNDQIFYLSTDDIRITPFTVVPFAWIDNILVSPHSISLSHMVICACFETTTIILDWRIQLCLSTNYCPIVLTLITKKCLKRLVVRCRKTRLTMRLEPLQVTYQPTRTIKDILKGDSVSCCRSG